MESKLYDIVIIGGGPGGYVAAIRAAQLGARVALVEKDRLGGTCLNRGCIPAKTLIHSAEVLEMVRRAPEFGIEVGEVTPNLKKMMERKRAVVGQLVSGIDTLMKANRIDIFKGRGSLLNPKTVYVKLPDDKTLTLNTKSLVLATGSVPDRLPLPGANEPGVITSDEALELEKIPSSTVIIGGGVVGVEMATFLRPLGTKITILEMLPTILAETDDELSRRYHQLLRRVGVEVQVNARVTEIARASDKELRVLYDTPQGRGEANGQVVLMATGRRPYTDGLALEEIGVRRAGRFLAVNERMETGIDGLYAIGDLTSSPMLAHVASHEGVVAVENALGRRRTADYSSIPNCIYSSPEIAWVGLTEKQATERGTPYKVSRFPFSANGRALTKGDTVGLVKMVCEQDSGKMLGVHIMGPQATDLIAEAALAVKWEATAEDLAEAIHAHPTLPEAIHEAALAQLDGAIHLAKL